MIPSYLSLLSHERCTLMVTSWGIRRRRMHSLDFDLSIVVALWFALILRWEARLDLCRIYMQRNCSKGRFNNNIYLKYKSISLGIPVHSPFGPTFLRRQMIDLFKNIAFDVPQRHYGEVSTVRQRRRQLSNNEFQSVNLFTCFDGAAGTYFSSPIDFESLGNYLIEFNHKSKGFQPEK